MRKLVTTPEAAVRVPDDRPNKIVRHCPRCAAHHYHFARAWQLQRSNPPYEGYGPIHVEILCTDCGHHWRGRFKKDEWE